MPLELEYSRRSNDAFSRLVFDSTRMYPVRHRDKIREIYPQALKVIINVMTWDLSLAGGRFYTINFTPSLLKFLR